MSDDKQMIASLFQRIGRYNDLVMYRTIFDNYGQLTSEEVAAIYGMWLVAHPNVADYSCQRAAAIMVEVRQ